MSKRNVTAFAIDPERVQVSDDGASVPPLPGLWFNDRAIVPSALGLTLAEMREMIETHSLPLVEVKVAEDVAIEELAPTATLGMESGADALERWARRRAPASFEESSEAAFPAPEPAIEADETPPEEDEQT